MTFFRVGEAIIGPAGRSIGAEFARKLCIPIIIIDILYL